MRERYRTSKNNSDVVGESHLDMWKLIIPKSKKIFGWVHTFVLSQRLWLYVAPIITVAKDFYGWWRLKAIYYINILKSLITIWDRDVAAPHIPKILKFITVHLHVLLLTKFLFNNLYSMLFKFSYDYYINVSINNIKWLIRLSYITAVILDI